MNVPELDVPLKTFPCPHDAIVVVPPLKTTAPPTTPTAVGTLVSLMLFRTREPPSEVLAVDVRTKMGVLTTVASIIASAPTDWVQHNAQHAVKLESERSPLVYFESDHR